MAVNFPLVLPGRPSRHGGPGYTIGSNAGVNESGLKSHIPSKYQMRGQGAQIVMTPFARQGNDKQRLANELAFEIKRARLE